MNNKFVTIHGHFYQPPRENPWSGKIDKQPSAKPFHDWNERILNECYAPNYSVKIKNRDNKTTENINNYKYLNFNFGPTLLDWLKINAPEVIQKLKEADSYSLSRLGHGNAIAQVYNHIIMPLASRIDRDTQVIWGIKHFENTFNRYPEGIWLAETAICNNTIKSLIDYNIKYTILSPTQARKVKKLRDDNYIDVSNNTINTKVPYRLFDTDMYGAKIPSRYIDVFFYDGPLSTDVSFSNVLGNAESFGKRINNIFEDTKELQLVNIATDGEVYGHHKKFSDIGLAYLFERVFCDLNIFVTNYASFLEKSPPKYEVILKNGPIGLGTAWSCSHGVGRWYRDCGCSTGGEASWNQHWRLPLREALNYLKSDIDEIFVLRGQKFFNDVWCARNNYINVIIDNTVESKKRFIEENCKKYSDKYEQDMWDLLEMTRNSMLMFTSCGWFFNDISGIETLQILSYAAKSIQYAKKYTRSFEKRFIDTLSHAQSNIKTMGNGSQIYIKKILSLKNKSNVNTTNPQKSSLSL